MNLWQQALKSFYSPKHIAAFRFQSIGRSIGHLFVLALLMVFPVCWNAFLFLIRGSAAARQSMEELLPFLQAVQGSSADSFIFIAAALLFYYALLSFALFVKAAVFAGIGMILAGSLNKRAEYRHTFRMAAWALTLPSVFTVFLEAFGFRISFAYVLNWLLCFLMLAAAVRFLPRKIK